MSIDVIAREIELKSEYDAWSKQVYSNTVYLLAPDNRSIAWPVSNSRVRFTWTRSGRSGPDRNESINDYVWRRFNGKGSKQDVRAVTQILEDLTVKYGSKEGYGKFIQRRL